MINIFKDLYLLSSYSITFAHTKNIGWLVKIIKIGIIVGDRINDALFLWMISSICSWVIFGKKRIGKLTDFIVHVGACLQFTVIYLCGSILLQAVFLWFYKNRNAWYQKKNLLWKVPMKAQKCTITLQEHQEEIQLEWAVGTSIFC